MDDKKKRRGPINIQSIYIDMDGFEEVEERHSEPNKPTLKGMESQVKSEVVQETSRKDEDRRQIDTEEYETMSTKQIPHKNLPEDCPCEEHDQDPAKSWLKSLELNNIKSHTKKRKWWKGDKS